MKDRARPCSAVGRLLVGYDGSPPSQRALDVAAQRAIQHGHELILLTVVPQQLAKTTMSDLLPGGLTMPGPLSKPFPETARSRLDALAEQLQRMGASVRVEVRAGATANEFLAVAEEMQVHEIVIGQRSFEGPGAQPGVYAEAITRGAKVPVTLVP